MDTQCQRWAPNNNIRHCSKLKDLGPLCGVKLTLCRQPSPYLEQCNLLRLDAHDLSVSTCTRPLDGGIAAYIFYKHENIYEQGNNEM